MKDSNKQNEYETRNPEEIKKIVKDQITKRETIYLLLYGAEEPDSMHIDFLSKEKGKNETESHAKAILIVKAKDYSLGHNPEAKIYISSMFKIENESIFDVDEIVEKIIKKNGDIKDYNYGVVLEYWEKIEKQILNNFKKSKKVDLIA